jgi:hypothetical protein
MAMPLAVAFVVVASRAAFADCPPTQTPASCALHDEGVTAFTAGKYDEAATKFRAAIAASPTSRSYLGYSQSVEGQGKIALAYETMLVAQKYSKEEMATRSSDPDVVGRAERIKYKLAELAGKISYVWLRLPDGVPPQRIVAVFREGEGDLASPLGRWIVVAPQRQVIFASLDDGSRVQMVANIAPGSQGTVVIPIRVATTTAPAPVQTQPTPFPGQTPGVYGGPLPPKPERKPTPNPPNVAVGVDAAFIVRDVEGVGPGIGFAAQFEKKLERRFAITARGVFAIHPSVEDELSLGEHQTVSAQSGLILVGVRTRSTLPIYAGLELGALIYSRSAEIEVQGLETRFDDYSHTFPAALAVGGLRIGKVHFEVGGIFVANTTDRDMPPRWFLTFGVDVLRR